MADHSKGKKEEHTGGLLSLVGGKVKETGESTGILESTLHRELSDEVGVKVRNMQYIRNTSFLIEWKLTGTRVLLV